jgi:uncharacterized protein YecE (DUF72 family)
VGIVRIGTAGWNIPRASGERFPGDGTHLDRYSRVLNAAEINSSFHRPHAREIYRRWAAAVPPSFRFSVKVPRTLTHDCGLRSRRGLRISDLLDDFVGQIAGLGRKLGPLLVQLPPSLAFDRRSAGGFFDRLRQRHRGAIVCEPRHESWFSGAAERLLVANRVARVATDPTTLPSARGPGGFTRLAYFRLHGSPRKYWSRYALESIDAWARQIAVLPAATEIWCIFDNTASGAAIENALELAARIREGV